MTPIFRFEGIYTPVVTPFHADGSVNRDAMADVIENLIDKGVHGLISGGSTGENYAQSVEERLDLARFTHERLERSPAGDRRNRGDADARQHRAGGRRTRDRRGCDPAGEHRPIRSPPNGKTR